jgi:Fe2+ transport system protein FeoA
MKIKNEFIGKVFEVNDVLKEVPCMECGSCVRMKLMEMGLFHGEKIKLVGKSHGLWRLDILNSKNTTVSTLALREEEVDRICVF